MGSKKDNEIAHMRQALEAIESLTDEEIGARFRTSSYKSEEQMAGKSVIYSILSLCRNMARAGLKPPESSATRRE